MSQIEFKYEQGHWGGWADDLGIIADQNTFIPMKRTGWYWRGPMRVTNQMHNWCIQNISKNKWDITFDYIMFTDEKDAILFALTFS